MASNLAKVKTRIKKLKTVKKVAHESNQSLPRRAKRFIIKYSKQINFALLIIGVILIVYPFYPEAEYLIDKKANPEKYEEIDISTEASRAEASNFIESNYKIKDRVMISSIGLDEPILFGSNQDSLKQGTWMKPISTKIGEAGNKVLTGHRFSYLGGAGPFYHLKKANIDDNVVLYVDDVYYKYKISEKIVVDETEVWIEDPRAEDVLTMYTCEGLDAKKRLVIIANRIKI